MKILDTKHKKKSAIITINILVLLLACIFKFGMKYQDPPIEYGLAINFGNSEVGSGAPVEKVREESVQEEAQEETQEEVVEEVEAIVNEQVNEDVITDEAVDDVPVVQKTKEVKEEVVKETPKEEKPIEEPKPVEKPKTVKKPKPSQSTMDALNTLKGTSKDGGSEGEGDDKEEGLKGNQNGDPNSNKYYGNSGTGSGGNYNLSGRKALSKPIQKPDCEEEGRVVVTIKVNQSGKVIKAEQGKGTTNSAPCLVDAAIKAASKTKWNPDDKAPSTQKGTIIYNFSLSK